MLLFFKKIKLLSASRLIQNIGLFTIVQCIGYIVPILTLPYLARVLGPEEWGRVAWMQVILGYFHVLTDWSFSLTGTKKIAAVREDKAEFSKFFLAGWTLQWCLCFIALCVLLALTRWAPFFIQFRPYAFYGAGVIVATVLFPVWLLSGLERMREIAIVQFISRAGAVPLIFLFVREPSDGAFVIAASAISGLLAGCAMIIWMWIYGFLEWRAPNFSFVKEIFIESASIFVSQICIILYTSIVPTILGAISGATSVGQYILADKIKNFVQSLMSPLQQVLYPRMSYLFIHDRLKAINLLYRFSFFVLTFSFFSSLVLFVFADKIILLAAGNDYRDAIVILRWLSPLPFILALSNIFVVQIMFPNNMVRPFNYVLRTTGLVSTVMIVFWISWLGAEGAAINTLIVECFVTGAMGFILYRNRSLICER